MAVVEIKEKVFWVGAIDWNKRDFHGYSQTKKGTTYNAYLLLDDKITLFDCVDERFKWDLYHQIASLVPLDKIDYLVVNHVEMDHSGALPFIVERAKPEKIFCSPMGKEFIEAHFHPKDWPLEVVKSGDEISLGKNKVQFLEARMLHWPDSMFSYLPQLKLLISNDAFGQNIASNLIFDDQHELKAILEEAKHYYANIILPFSPLVQKTLAKVEELGLQIEMIAPDHGLIWRSHVQDILQLYQEMSSQKLKSKAVIVYDTMWHSTEKMAKAIAEGLNLEGVEVKLMHLKKFHHSDVMGEVMDAAAVICGSPTHNNNMLPLMADFLTYMKGLRPKNRLGATFGSYGWSGEAPKLMAKVLEEAGFELPYEPLRIRFVPEHSSLASCKELGINLAQKIKEKV